MSAPLPPPFPRPGRRLVLPGFGIGHGTDREGKTGVTVILCPEGALGAAEVRGSATGTRQFDSLVLAHHVASRAHAVVLAGGSGFGLAAADPVVARLEERGRGFDAGVAVVPLVPTAILFDLGFGDPRARPGAALSRAALDAAELSLAADRGGPGAGEVEDAGAATGPGGEAGRGAAADPGERGGGGVVERPAGGAGAGGAVAPGDGGGVGPEVPVGSVGAGTGATVGKAGGLECAMKGGFGFASLSVPGGPTVAAAVAVNAFGDVRDPFDPSSAPGPDGLLAACREAADSRRLVGAHRVAAALPPDLSHPWEGNTTLAVVMTDAALPKPSLLKVCQMAFGGLYRTLSPALSLYDGDLVVALTCGTVPAHVNQVGVLAEHAIAHAILTAVREARGFDLLPAVCDL